MPKFTPISVHDLGEYLREQRQSAPFSLGQLSDIARISSYVSKIEHGLKKPSAEVLQALAKTLRISAESLYPGAGIIGRRTHDGDAGPVDVTDAVLADPKLNDPQRAILLDVYESFWGKPAAGKAAPASVSTSPRATRPAKARRTPSPAHEPGTPAHPEITPKEKQS
jgi:transcriptional regulator with XRE-family HTH domain